MNHSANNRFQDLLVSACERPGMYVGRNSLWDLSHYFAGFCHGADVAGVSIKFGMRFQRWIESKFCIFGAGWHWVRILQHEYGDDQSAIAALPALYDEFCAIADNMTDEELWDLMERRLVEVRGTKHWYPDEADTWTKPHSQA